MKISNIFKNSLSYPLSDYKKLLFIGIIVVIAQLSVIVEIFKVDDSIALILGILTIIFGLIISGYQLSVIKATVERSDIIPDFDWVKNIIMGIKNVVLSIVYFIIPTIIVFLVAWASGLFDSAANVSEFITGDAINQTAISAVPTATLNAFAGHLTFVFVVAVILFIIFALFNVIANCRLADTDSLKEALNIKKVYLDITEIGWGKFIGWAIAYGIIYLLIVCVAVAVAMIPYVGLILSYLIVSSFLILFGGRSYGLIYAGE